MIFRNELKFWAAKKFKILKDEFLVWTCWNLKNNTLDERSVRLIRAGLTKLWFYNYSRSLISVKYTLLEMMSTNFHLKKMLNNQHYKMHVVRWYACVSKMDYIQWVFSMHIPIHACTLKYFIGCLIMLLNVPLFFNLYEVRWILLLYTLKISCASVFCAFQNELM